MRSRVKARVGSGNPTEPLDASLFVTTALVTRAFRRAGLLHDLRRGPLVVLLVGVEPSTERIVRQALYDLLGRLGDDKAEVEPRLKPGYRNLNSGWKHSDSEDWKSAMEGSERLCYLFTDRDSVPELLAMMADGLAEMPPPDPVLVRAAVIRRLGRVPSPGEVRHLMGVPIELLEATLRSGRSPAVSRRSSIAWRP